MQAARAVEVASVNLCAGAAAAVGTRSNMQTVSGAAHRDAFVSSCFANPATSMHKLSDMCLASACSLRHHHPRRTAKASFVYLVNEGVSETVRGTLRQHVDSLIVVPPLVWPSSAGAAPRHDRLYSYLKIYIWQLSQFDRLLYFDPDVFWTGDAWRYFERYGHAVHLAAARYTGDLVPSSWRSSGMPYLNSGVLLLRPSPREYESLRRRWELGNFTSMGDAPRVARRAGGLAGRSKASTRRQQPAPPSCCATRLVAEARAER